MVLDKWKILLEFREGKTYEMKKIGEDLFEA